MSNAWLRSSVTVLPQYNHCGINTCVHRMYITRPDLTSGQANIFRRNDKWPQTTTRRCVNPGAQNSGDLTTIYRRRLYTHTPHNIRCSCNRMPPINTCLPCCSSLSEFHACRDRVVSFGRFPFRRVSLCLRVCVWVCGGRFSGVMSRGRGRWSRAGPAYQRRSSPPSPPPRTWSRGRRSASCARWASETSSGRTSTPRSCRYRWPGYNPGIRRYTSLLCNGAHKAVV